jgi:hypothetical protein
VIEIEMEFEFVRMTMIVTEKETGNNEGKK